VIARGLRAVPAAVWASVPGLLIVIWWLGHEPASVALQAELDEVQARIEELDEYKEWVDELPALKRELMVQIELIRRLKDVPEPIAPALNELFRILPRDLAIERLSAEEPAWDLRLDLLQADPEALRVLADELLESPLVNFAGVIERADGALTLHLELAPRPGAWP